MKLPNKKKAPTVRKRRANCTVKAGPALIRTETRPAETVVKELKAQTRILYIIWGERASAAASDYVRYETP
eukprot:4318148-Heterocapsa_arctica.AAC.1